MTFVPSDRFISKSGMIPPTTEDRSMSVGRVGDTTLVPLDVVCSTAVLVATSFELWDIEDDTLEVESLLIAFVEQAEPPKINTSNIKR